MANYDLEVSNSGAYNPLALQAFAEVQQGLTDQYNTSMAAYGELESKANLLEKLANDVKGKDSIAYQNYMNYANALRQHTDTLATYGINPNLTRNLMQARSDYSRIIHPIEEAWQARQNEAKRQADYLKAHPGTMFEKDASKMGIDEWLKNPTYQAQSVDLDNVSKIAGERFAAIKDKLQQFVSEAQAGGLNPATATAEDVKRWCKVKGVPYLYDAIEKYGANPDDVRALLSGDPRMMNSMLQHIVDETMAQTGVNTWNTDYDHYTRAQNEQNRRNIFERARGAIAGEATKSIGTDKFDKYTDDITWKKDLEWAQLAETKRHNKAMEDLANERAAGKGSGSDAASKLATSKNTLVNDEGQEVTYDEVKNYLLQSLSKQAGENGPDITETQLEDALKSMGISSLVDLKKSIEDGTFGSPEFMNDLYAKAADQDLGSNSDALYHFGKGILHGLSMTVPGWGLWKNAATFIQRRLVDKEEDKWNYSWDDMINNFKAYSLSRNGAYDKGGLNEAMSYLDNGDKEKALKSAREAINKNKGFWAKDVWNDLAGKPDSYILDELDRLNKQKKQYLKDLVNANVGFKSTKTAASEINNVISTARKDHPELAGYDDAYLFQSIIDGRVRNRKEYRSSITGATKEAFVEGFTDNVNASLFNGNLSSIKSVDDDGEEKSVKWEDWEEAIKNAGDNFYIITNSNTPNRMEIQAGNEKFVINVGDLNEETRNSVKAKLEYANMWDEYANPKNIHLRESMPIEVRAELVNNFDDNQMLAIDRAILKSGKMNASDMARAKSENNTSLSRKYNDLQTQFMCIDMENRYKERGTSDAVRGALMGSNKPNSIPEDTEFVHEVFGSPSINNNPVNTDMISKMLKDSKK